MLDLALGDVERDQLLQALKGWGLLDDEYRYRSSLYTAVRRGYATPQGGGVVDPPTAGPLLELKQLLHPSVWQGLNALLVYNAQDTMFQPVGGIDQITAGFMRALPYTGFTKVALEFRRRFWEEDDGIYGGNTLTDQDIDLIAYPPHGMMSDGPAVLIGAYATSMAKTLRLTGMSPQERIETALAQGEKIHPQYRKEFLSGVAVSWYRVPWMLGCRVRWSNEARKAHYDALSAINGRLVLAGDHISYMPGWMEGALLSSLDAIQRLHQRVQAG